MARLPLVNKKNADPKVQTIFDKAFPKLDAFSNQIGTLAHQPAIAANLVTLYLSFYEDSVVEARYIELAILTASHLNRCQYCITHHTPMGADSGLNQAQLTALQDNSWSTSFEFDELEKLIIVYATHITEDARRVPDNVFDGLRLHFNEAQIVELTVRIAMCNFFNRFNDALSLDIEPDALLAYKKATKQV